MLDLTKYPKDFITDEELKGLENIELMNNFILILILYNKYIK